MRNPCLLPEICAGTILVEVYLGGLEKQLLGVQGWFSTALSQCHFGPDWPHFHLYSQAIFWHLTLDVFDVAGVPQGGTCRRLGESQLGCHVDVSNCCSVSLDYSCIPV